MNLPPQRVRIMILKLRLSNPGARTAVPLLPRPSLCLPPPTPVQVTPESAGLSANTDGYERVMIGRTSTEPYRAHGILVAIASASSALCASTR
jgi:hypothetical protein